MAIGILTGTVKNYDWGGNSFIPSLLNLDIEPGVKFAEYWLGVHPQAECRIIWADGSSVSLREFIGSDPVALLSKKVYDRFHNLPYLFKALDVKDMLSIQVHPSKQAAVKDFAEENAKGVALNDPARNYK